MLTEIVNDYRTLQNSIDKLIDMSGLKMGFIIENLGMDRTSFYLKRKKHSFTVNEIESLLKIIRADELEDKVLNELSLDSEESGEFVEYKPFEL